MVVQARQYSFDFLRWKKAYVLRRHWLAHNRSPRPRDGIPFTRAYLGKTHRRSVFCERCQKKYA
jgi:endonuclease VIII